MATAHSWHDVRAKAIREGRATEAGIAAARRVQGERVRAYRLRQVREAQHANQTDLAQRMHVSQSRVSRIENGELTSTELGTLKAYIEALGGKLEMVADFGDEKLTLG